MTSLTNNDVNAFECLQVVGAVGYAAFIYVSKDDKDKDGGGGGGGSPDSEDPLEEARRIMEKYK